MDTFPRTVAANVRRYTAVHPSAFSYPLQYAIHITSTICASFSSRHKKEIQTIRLKDEIKFLYKKKRKTK